MKRNNVLKIDIHGMTSIEGKKAITDLISHAHDNTNRIIVIHGFTGGTVLRDMVRKIWHKRIEEIVPTFANDGETVIYLKKL